MKEIETLQKLLNESQNEKSLFDHLGEELDRRLTITGIYLIATLVATIGASVASIPLIIVAFLILKNAYDFGVTGMCFFQWREAKRDLLQSLTDLETQLPKARESLDQAKAEHPAIINEAPAKIAKPKNFNPFTKIQYEKYHSN